jgi:DNA-binding winged helix-turn-helix (wHTH) protein
MRVTFGRFTFDHERRLLMRGAEPVHLGPKAFDLLQILLTARPNVVSKAVLMKALWPTTFVEENNLATLITDLRTALGDHARSAKLIRTAHGVGYAFIMNAVDVGGEHARTTDAQLSDWKLLWGQTELPLIVGENLIGRPADGVIGLNSPTVSRQHARIVISGDEATLEDLGSKNGSWVGSIKVTGTHPLKHGDEIRFGLVAVVLLRSVNDVSTRTVT